MGTLRAPAEIDLYTEIQNAIAVGVEVERLFVAPEILPRLAGRNAEQIAPIARARGLVARPLPVTHQPFRPYPIGCGGPSERPAGCRNEDVRRLVGPRGGDGHLVATTFLDRASTKVLYTLAVKCKKPTAAPHGASEVIREFVLHLMGWSSQHWLPRLIAGNAEACSYRLSQPAIAVPWTSGRGVPWRHT
jgi:hypothetical protein